MSRGHKPGHHEPMEETIGILALQLAQSLALLAHGFGDNDTTVVIVGTGPTPLASVTITPQRTGKFQVTGAAIATNSDALAAHTFVLAVGHSSTVDYSQNVGINLMAQSGVPPSQQAYEQSNAITMQYGSTQVPLTFPVGTPVTLVLFGQASVAGQVFISPHQAQITVVELPN
jgi:hypothetical protein